VSLTAQLAEPTADHPTEEAEFLWRAALRDRLATMDVWPTNQCARGGSMQCRDLGDLLITDWECGGVQGTRGSAAARGDAEALVLFTASAGRQLIETAQDTLLFGPGALLMMTTRATGSFVVPERLRKRTVRIPLTALSPFDTGDGVPDCLMLDANQHPLAGLVQDYLVGVDEKIDRMSPVEVEGARNALLVLVAGMIRAAQAPELSQSDFLPFLRRRLEAWVVEHLTTGAIRVRDLAAAHNVAPRTVHRAFAATGDTVGSIVRAHRIAGARSDLVNTALPIAAIAHRWGFCDASHLGREFRRQFSMSPGDYREAHAVA